jgi:hypothetical protein
MTSLKTLALLFCLSLTPHLSAQPQMVILPGDTGNTTGRSLVWSTEPGIRYKLQVSDDLNDPLAWDTVDGFPNEAYALAQQHEIATITGDHLFYRVVALDEQPPTISSRLPGNG